MGQPVCDEQLYHACMPLLQHLLYHVQNTASSSGTTGRAAGCPTNQTGQQEIVNGAVSIKVPSGTVCDALLRSSISYTVMSKCKSSEGKGDDVHRMTLLPFKN